MAQGGQEPAERLQTPVLARLRLAQVAGCQLSVVTLAPVNRQTKAFAFPTCLVRNLLPFTYGENKERRPIRMTSDTVDGQLRKCGQLFCLLLLLAIVSGCVPVPLPTEAEYEQTGHISEPLKSGEAIALLLSGARTAPKIETAEQCLKEAIHTKSPETRVVTSDEFRRSVFSYRAPDDPAARTKYFQLLFSQPVLNERMGTLGIRYVFFLESATTTAFESSGGGVAGGHFVAFGGKAGGDRTSSLKLTVYDIRRSGEVGGVDVRATGWVGVAGGGVAPFALFIMGLSFTENRVCDELAGKIEEFLLIKRDQPDRDTPLPEGKSQ
jgi:hypothetical protein